MKKTISILVAVSIIVVAGTVAGGYIEKPINPETFIAEIQKYL